MPYDSTLVFGQDMPLYQLPEQVHMDVYLHRGVAELTDAGLKQPLEPGILFCRTKDIELNTQLQHVSDTDTVVAVCCPAPAAGVPQRLFLSLACRGVVALFSGYLLELPAGRNWIYASLLSVGRERPYAFAATHICS